VQIIGGGDRKGYQQDWRNAREALTEVEADIEQGADMVMVKPALAYLDVIAAVRQLVNVPTEHLTAIKRAGADIILTYLARWYGELTNG
jgi:porphobilinogen synthase